MESSHKIFIKNMVCPRCITVVKQELLHLGYHIIDIDLGYAIVKETPELVEIEKSLHNNGFELLADEKLVKVEKIKTAILLFLQQEQIVGSSNLSDWLSKKLNIDYAHLSQVFSAVEETTIEQYYIHQRIEKVKKLLSYKELSVKEIAYKLGFSSVSHLSAQFKKITNLTTSEFKSQLS